MTKTPLMPVADALKRILDAVEPLPTTIVPITEAFGRVLAEDVLARVTNPPLTASAMDGYAVRTADLDTIPATLTVVAETAAGDTPATAIAAGQCVRIFTGAPLPPQADAVVIQENTNRRGDRVEILAAVMPGKNTRAAGLDFKAGDRLLAAGTRLDPRRLGLLAAADISIAPVRRRPRIGILASGNELYRPGAPHSPHQIPSSNSIALSAMITSLGGIAVDLGIARDTVDDIQERMKSIDNLDLIITSGGASVGDHDLMQSALKDIGLELDFWKIAMRPGKPLMFGRLNGTPLLGLPGNPVSAVVCAYVFVIPLVRRMLGLTPEAMPLAMARLTTPLGANDERQDHLRATIRRRDDGQLDATVFPRQDSSMQAILASADGLILRPPHAPAAHVGELVPIIALRPVDDESPL